MEDNPIEKIDKIFSETYYLEAFGQLDKLIDDSLIYLLSSQVKYDKLAYMLVIHGKIRGRQIATVLNKMDILGKDTLKKINDFKEIRNKQTHSVDVELETIFTYPEYLEMSKENRKKTLDDYLAYYRKILVDVMIKGKEAYSELQLLSKKYRPTPITEQQLREEIEEVYRK